MALLGEARGANRAHGKGNHCPLQAASPEAATKEKGLLGSGKTHKPDLALTTDPLCVLVSGWAVKV